MAPDLIKLLQLKQNSAQLTVVANRANLETKFLVPVPKIRHGDIEYGERVGQRGVELQHRPLLPWAGLRQRKHTQQIDRPTEQPVSKWLQMRASYLTAVVQRADVLRVFLRQFFPVGASEAQCKLVALGGAVQPGGRVEAVVGEGLLGCCAQKLQEGQLDHMDRNTLWPRVGKLQKNWAKIKVQTFIKYNKIQSSCREQIHELTQTQRTSKAGSFL